VNDPRIPVKYPNLQQLVDSQTHPGDKELSKESAEDGLLRVRAFVEANIDEIAKLFWLYPDNEAEELFAVLRERFWTAPMGDKGPGHGK
jgi:hypothetical protein